MKGLILSGGSGSRLYPATRSVNKQLLPIYDKPMIYYPISVLMLAGIREILMITRPEDGALYHHLLGDGQQFGLSISYIFQPAPNGLAEAFILGESFLGGEPSALILGDNLFYGHGLAGKLQDAAKLQDGATIFPYYVKDPSQYGVVNFDADGRVIGIEEKPAVPKSHYAVPGLYFFDGQASTLAHEITPSARGELEITDLIGKYIKRGILNAQKLGRGYAWLDTGTHDSLLNASLFVRTVEERQGLKIGCLEEIALRMGFIDITQFEKTILFYKNSAYGDYLREVLNLETAL